MLPQPAGNPPPLKGLRQHRFVLCCGSEASTLACKAPSAGRRGHGAAKRIGLSCYECVGPFLRPGCSGSGPGNSAAPVSARLGQVSSSPGNLPQPRTGVSFTLRAPKPLQFQRFLHKLVYSGNMNNNLRQYNRFCHLLWRGDLL